MIIQQSDIKKFCSVCACFETDKKIKLCRRCRSVLNNVVWIESTSTNKGLTMVVLGETNASRN